MAIYMYSVMHKNAYIYCTYNAYAKFLVIEIKTFKHEKKVIKSVS